MKTIALDGRLTRDAARKSARRIKGVDDLGTVPGTAAERYPPPDKQAQPSSSTMDTSPYRDATGGYSMADCYDAYCKARDRRLSRDAGAAVQTSRRKATITGVR
jgi:hypothetical protein